MDCGIASQTFFITPTPKHVLSAVERARLQKRQRKNRNDLIKSAGLGSIWSAKANLQVSIWLCCKNNGVLNIVRQPIVFIMSKKTLRGSNALLKTLSGTPDDHQVVR